MNQLTPERGGMVRGRNGWRLTTADLNQPNRPHWPGLVYRF